MDDIVNERFAIDLYKVKFVANRSLTKNNRGYANRFSNRAFSDWDGISCKE